jgi:alpha-tubulin suppressor-like RCC1 family protein
MKKAAYGIPLVLASLWLASCSQQTLPPANPILPTVIDSFGAEPSPVPNNVPLVFSWSVSGTDLTCSVDVNNDGTAEYTVNPCSSSSRAAHVYGVEGSFTAQLTVTGADGQTLRRSTSVTAGPENRPPGILGVEVSQGSSPNSLKFSWTVSDEGGSTLRCKLDADGDGSWEYDRYCDGSTDTSSLISTASVTASSTEISLPVGTYDSIFEVSDAYSSTRVRRKSRNPVNREPQINTFTATSSADLIGKINFSVSDPDSDAMRCLLKVQSIGDFYYPDCTSITRTYKFPQIGTYTIKLEVLDALNGSASRTLKLVFAPDTKPLVEQISAGGKHVCAINSLSQAYCWGNNSSGQLGNGQTDPNGFTSLNPTPQAVVGGLTFKSIYAGSQHSCGLTGSGAAYCWGENSDSQLGIGNNTNQNTPQLISGFTFVQLTLGDDHTCGRTGIGQVYCWGSNQKGQLGLGDNQIRTTPQLVSGYTFTDLAAGTLGVSTCGVVTGGAAYCWGYGDDGQLGNNTYSGANTPQVVSGSLIFQQLVQSTHMCGLTTAGSTYCWGWNPFGQLGLGDNAERTTPQPVAGLDFVQLSTGGSHTCGLLANGTAYCWGWNNAGQLGIGNNTNQNTPQAISGLAWRRISGGNSHTCGITLAGAAYCWGNNQNGRLGVGDAVSPSRSTPTLVTMP